MLEIFNLRSQLEKIKRKFYFSRPERTIFLKNDKLINEKSLHKQLANNHINKFYHSDRMKLKI